MVQTIVTPINREFDLSVSLPANYVGKEVHVLFYIDEEVKSTTATISSKKKPSDFLGIFTKEEGVQFDKHIQQIRSEWGKDI